MWPQHREVSQELGTGSAMDGLIPVKNAWSAMNETCSGRVEMNLFLHCSLVPSVFIVFILSFLQRRVKRHRFDERIPALNGRFAIIVPLDFIDSLRNRWSYGFAFGAVASSVLLLFSEEYVPTHFPAWSKAIISLIGALEVGLAYYPLFACLSTPFKVIGGTLGILYTLSWIVVTMFNIIKCPSGTVIGKYQSAVVHWPVVLCQLFLAGRFVFMVVKGILVYLKLDMDEDHDQLLHAHHTQYVMRLLKKPTLQLEQKNWLQRTIYTWDPCFKFPNRMIGTSVISLICMYIFVLAEHSVSAVAFGELEDLCVALRELAAENNMSASNLDGILPQLEELSGVLRDSWLISSIFACLMSVVYIFHVLKCYREHIRRLRAGVKSFVPLALRNSRAAVSVAALARYSGWQIAYFLWGYLIVHSVLFLLGVALAYMFVLPVRHGQGMQLLSALEITLISVGLVIGLLIFQIVLAQLFFLQDKVKPEDKSKPLALNNKRAFHNFSYFFFFYNVILGFSNCVLRLLCSFVVGTFLVSRIDRTIMPRGYESADMGFNTWVGMLLVDHHHSHPVLLCFCHLLLAGRQEMPTCAESQYSQGDAGEASRRRSRCRWLLLYTLLKNPGLIVHRKKKDSQPASSLIRVALSSVLLSRRWEGSATEECANGTA
ncbi:STRA6-like isoform X2 [Erpetoichthys calabaricus]|uniref:STRA6-like isoform X2 n=1 Tax=Erpetoichthys calabaricus TaxID=27687 RepID=UPI00109FAAA9|nr:STRA6-like isoform X2 [Erpetoichthys calabaricus]